MAWFGKKKTDEENIINDAAAAEEQMPKGMKDIAARMMSGEFTLNDMLAQLKQVKKMSNFGGLLKMVPGMKDAVGAMKEKIASGEIDQQIKILEAMSADERATPDKIFANAKLRIAESSGASVRDVEHLIKRYEEMQRQMKMLQRMGGMEAVMERMKNGGAQ